MYNIKCYFVSSCITNLESLKGSQASSISRASMENASMLSNFVKTGKSEGKLYMDTIASYHMSRVNPPYRI